jgi:hypothetical protein
MTGIAHRLVEEFHVIATFRQDDNGDRRFFHSTTP